MKHFSAKSPAIEAMEVYGQDAHVMPDKFDPPFFKILPLKTSIDEMLVLVKWRPPFWTLRAIYRTMARE